MDHNRTSTGPPRTVATRGVVFACAASAGIHAGLVPSHLREEPRLGVAFLLAVVGLVAIGAATACCPADRATSRFAVMTLAGLACAYVATRTAGIPLLAPDPEPVDVIGIASVAIEAAGVMCGLRLVQPDGLRFRRPIIQEVAR